MFGYVTINKLELKVKDYYKYQSYYCGLCNELKKRYGRFGQMTLTYDMTFLIILLSSLYEADNRKTSHRCLVHPARKHLMLSNEITEYAADMNIVMAYHNFRDDWQDEKKISKLAGAVLLRKNYELVSAKYPRQCIAVEEALKELAECEKRSEKNLDIVSDCFGKLLGELFVYRQDQWKNILKETGKYLGKFIYLIDAYDDLEKDRRSGNYNPFYQLSLHEDFKKNCQEILNLLIAECAANFEKLPLVQDIEILKNIIYTGVWIKFKKQ